MKTILGIAVLAALTGLLAPRAMAFDTRPGAYAGMRAQEALSARVAQNWQTSAKIHQAFNLAVQNGTYSKMMQFRPAYYGGGMTPRVASQMIRAAAGKRVR